MPHSFPSSTLPRLIEQWLVKLALGEIRFDPRRVETRWVVAPAENPGRFKAILNGNRKARPQ